jgi:hypothetical protein
MLPRSDMLSLLLLCGHDCLSSLTRMLTNTQINRAREFCHREKTSTSFEDAARTFYPDSLTLPDHHHPTTIHSSLHPHPVPILTHIHKFYNYCSRLRLLLLLVLFKFHRRPLLILPRALLLRHPIQTTSTSSTTPATTI